jgi:hypothetical protein
MRQFPTYPVLRLRVKPGEAYIAPTDNLIHDGSSVGKQFPDITIHNLGYFGVAQNVSAVVFGCLTKTCVPEIVRPPITPV